MNEKMRGINIQEKASMCGKSKNVAGNGSFCTDIYSDAIFSEKFMQQVQKKTR